MYSRKSVGPRMEPCGTPALTGYSCFKLKILENNQNSVATHSSFYTLVQRIHVNTAVSIEKNFSNQGS